MPGIFCFGPYRFDVDQNLLTKDGNEVPLRHQTARVLAELLTSRGRVLVKKDLLEKLWPGTFVQEQAVTHCINEIRKAFEDSAQEPRFVKTVPKLGYKWIYDSSEADPVSTLQESSDGEDGEMEPIPACSESNPSTDDRADSPEIVAAAADRSANTQNHPTENEGEAPAAVVRPTWTRLAAVACTLMLLIAAGVYYGVSRSGASLKPIGSEDGFDLVVLDFNNTTGEPDLSGLSGLLITSLEQEQRLRVLTRSGMFDLVGRELDDSDLSPEALGVTLGRRARARAVIVPVIRKFDSLYHIDYKALDPNGNTYLFTGKESARNRETLPDLIDRISQRIRWEFGLEPSREPIQDTKVAEKTTANLAAYHHFFEGEEYAYRYQWELAREAFQKAVALDPEFGLAYYSLAGTYYYSKDIMDPSGLKQARINYGEAKRLERRIPTKYRKLLEAEWTILERVDIHAGLDILLQAEKDYPQEKRVLFLIGDCLHHLKRFRQAEQYFRRVLEVDDQFPYAWDHLCWNLKEQGRLEEFAQAARQWVKGAPDSVMANAYWGLSIGYTKSLDLGVEMLERLKMEKPDECYIVDWMLNGLHFAGLDFERLTPGLSDQKRFTVIEDAYKGRIHELSSYLPTKCWFHRDYLQNIPAGHVTLCQALLFKWTHDVKLENVWLPTDQEILEMGSKNPFLVACGGIDLVENYFLWQVLNDDIDGARKTAVKKPDSIYPEDWEAFTKALLLVMEGRCDLALDQLPDTPYYQVRVLMPMAECLWGQGDLHGALAVLERFRSLKVLSWDRVMAVNLARSFYLSGRIYEALGENVSAVKHYRHFLEVWKDADKDLPELIDGRKRLDAISSSSGQMSKLAKAVGDPLD